VSAPALELGDLGESFRAAREAAREKLRADLEAELYRRLHFELAKKLPHWHPKDLELRERLEVLGCNEANRSLRLSIELTPARTHPDIGWVYDLDLAEVKVLQDLGFEVVGSSTNGEHGQDLVVYVDIGEYRW
jgi:hypothetical protein